MSYTLEFEIQGAPMMPNDLRGRHWSVIRKHNRNWQTMTWARCSGARRPPEPLKRAKLTLTRFSAAGCDFDNMVASWKPVIDGLVRAGVIADDNPDVLPPSKQVFELAGAPKKQQRIRVRVEELD